jgi:hypothetical protein
LFFFQVLNDNNPDGKYILSYCDFPWKAIAKVTK